MACSLHPGVPMQCRILGVDYQVAMFRQMHLTQRAVLICRLHKYQVEGTILADRQV